MKYWLNRYQKEGNVNTKRRTVHRKALTEDQEAEIILKIQENPFLTAISFAREYGVSDYTILALFKRNGIKCRVAAKQTRLTEEHRINRLAFCENMLEWENEKLSSIVFSDEKSFCSDVRWRSQVYRPFNTRYQPEYVKSESLSGRISANYWGAISIAGPVTDLVKIDGKFNQMKYYDIITNHLIPIMRPELIFMQDNSPVHSANSCMELLGKQTFETMEWPPLSPDLNPIENVWSYMIRDWPLMANRTENALDELVQQRWNELRNKRSIIIELNVFFKYLISIRSLFLLRFLRQSVSLAPHSIPASRRL